MTTAYNVLNRLRRAKNADRGARLDPGSGGVIIVSPVDDGYCTLGSTGARTLEDATLLGVGTRITIVSQAAGASCNTVALADGEFTVFIVITNSSGVNVWAKIGTAQ